VAVSTLSLTGASAVGAKFGFLSFMSAMKMKGTVAAVGAALLGVATLVVQHREVGDLREENRALRSQSAELESLKKENTQLQKGRIALASKKWTPVRVVFGFERFYSGRDWRT
jgi:hypothetical protein